MHTTTSPSPRKESEKSDYLAPTLTVAEFASELGYASTLPSSNTEHRTDGGLITNGADSDGWF